MVQRLAWFRFYTYGYLPIGVISYSLGLLGVTSPSGTAGLTIYRQTFPPFFPEWTFTMVAVITIVINCILIFGLSLHKLWGWYLNWFALILCALFGALQSYSGFYSYLCSALMYAAFWVVPNGFYFARRRQLFS